MKSMEMTQSTTDPCLYHKWGKERLVLIVSWNDNNLIIGSKKAVEKTKKDIMERFDCKDCGDIEEYMGSKIVRTKNSLKFTQPVLMQSYNDKFKLPKKSYRMPAPKGSVLVADKKDKGSKPSHAEELLLRDWKSHACNTVLQAGNVQFSARSVLPHAQGYAGSLQGHGTCT
jgi:hypothetical protein